MKILTFYLSGDHDFDSFGDDLESSMGEFHFDVLMSCHHQGQCDDDVREASRFFEIIDYDKAMRYLIDCGLEEETFIDSDGNKDEPTILEYYLWILAGDIQDAI